MRRMLTFSLRNSGLQAESIMKAGGLVADEIMLRLISNELKTRGWLFGGGPKVMTLSSEATNVGSDSSSASAYHDSTPDLASLVRNDPSSSFSSLPSDDPAASFILDGYPRSAAQATTLDPLIPINLAVSLRTPESIILKRISSRWVHEPSAASTTPISTRPRSRVRTTSPASR